MLAWKEYDAGRCQRCGTREEDWIDPETGRVVTPPPYTVKPKPCGGCGAISIHQGHHDYSEQSSKDKGERPEFFPYDEDEEDGLLDMLA